jgi:carboxypeptidase C (cathepsin A)
VGEFIRLYLTRYQRWSSPLFLAGESYGTTRAAGLAGHLVDKGIGFNGIVLISTALNLRPIFFEQGDDLPFQLFVPTYAPPPGTTRSLTVNRKGKNCPTLWPRSNRGPRAS